MGRLPRRMPLAQSTPHRNLPPLPPAALYHYWHPDRDGVEPCPAWFARRLTTVHHDLAICRPPGQAPTVSRPWLVWYRKPEVTHWISPGWILLFCWQTEDKTPLPLDDRVLANVYSISAMHFGSARAYFDSVVATLLRDKERSQQQDKDLTDAKRRDFFQSMKIKNIGRGNKFALHHDGTVLPSRNEQNWSNELELSMLPGEQAKALRDRRRQIRSRRRESQ